MALQVFSGKELILDPNKKLIQIKFKNPVRHFAIQISKNLWNEIDQNVPEQFRTILSGALENIAKEMLKKYLDSFSVIPSEISENLFSDEAILENANSQQNLTKEEFEELWRESETRKFYISSDKYKNNGSYRKVFARFEELILKLQGTKSQFAEGELDTILAKIKDEDFSGEFGNYVARRIDYFKKKPAKMSDDLDLL